VGVVAEGADGGQPDDAPAAAASPIENPGPEDAYALARCMTSEEEGASELVRTAVCWAIVNRANRKGRSPTDIIKTKRSYYGYGPQSDGSYVASGKEAAARDVELAGRIVAGEVPDPTEGAEEFDSPSTQDWQYRHGQVSKDSAMVAASRESEGKREVHLPGEDPYKFRLWTKKPATGGVA
jgi:spore germination cell wall hydrolase CwlJ-like protein